MSLSVSAQKNKILRIEAGDANSNVIINQIGYNNEIPHDTLYQKEIKLFRKKLNRLGFISSNMELIEENDSSYQVKLTLNEAIKYIELKHASLPELSKDFKYDLTKSNGLKIPFSELVPFLDQIVSHYQNNAYPFVKAKLKTIVKKGDWISADLEINKNEKRSIDNIIIKGYSNFPISFVNQQFGIVKNDLFSKKKITQISNLIKSNKFVSEIKKPELLFTKDSTSLFLYLKREKSNFFDGLIGFSTSPENGKIQLYGNIDLQIQNSLNKGESLNINWLSSQNQSQSLKLALEAPYIFNTPFVAAYKFNIHKQDTSFIATSHFLKTDFQLNNKHKIGLILETEKSNSTSNYNSSSISNFASLFYGVSYTYAIASNNPLFNNKIYLSSYVSQGKRDETKQNKIANHIQYLIKISKNQNIELKNTTEILISDDFLENELFRIGGSKSIRGFDENSFFTSNYSYLNSAYNYLLDDASYLSILADLGVIKNSIDSSFLTTYSFGIGFTQQTKIGQLGVQYFVGNTSNNSFDFSNSKLHIKLTQPF